ncbi:hypothetical protein HOY80DRAFT_947213 [Tuber brumale]|nr:hypothetical protein HOY80DRAFT_947213 [Tuber brumale]
MALRCMRYCTVLKYWYCTPAILLSSLMVTNLPPCWVVPVFLTGTAYDEKEIKNKKKKSLFRWAGFLADSGFLFLTIFS